jgi:hypothetical protein
MEARAQAPLELHQLESPRLHILRGSPLPAHLEVDEEHQLTACSPRRAEAAQLGLFAIVVGIALLLSGIGFGVLAAAGGLRSEGLALFRPAAAVKPTPAAI